MVKPINKDVISLAQKAKPATKDDLPIARDLLDTLLAHRGECVGMAANMIGKSKAIIAVEVSLNRYVVMLNPVVVSRSGAFNATEGCLSLAGQRLAKRFRRIKLSFLDMAMNEHTEEFSGRAAQIIQHELDHLEGILI